MTNDAIRSLQVLRGLAALAVVAHHASRAVTVNKGALILGAPWLTAIPGLRQFGACGVDIFFVLSGFLMVYISGPYCRREKSTGTFLVQRVIRIWPMYAVTTTWLIAHRVMVWHRTGELPFDLRPIRIASILFVPSQDQNRALQPILGVGWTLNYEFLFYLLFAVALVIGKGRLLFKLIGLLLLAHVIGRALAVDSTVGRFLGNSIVFEFAFGALIARQWKRGALRMQPWSAAIFGMLVLTTTARCVPDEYWRFATTGIGAAALFVGFLNLEGRVTWPKSVALLGDASYSIYLVHIIVIYDYAMPVLARLSNFYGRDYPPPADLVALGLVMASLLIGCVAYQVVEKPLLALARRMLLPTSDRAPFVSRSLPP